MTTAQPDRLDRIEALLERMAIESERSRLESDVRMTRIDERLEHFISGADERMEELTAVTQATSRDVAQLVATQQQSSQALNEAMIRLADTQEGIVRLLSSLDEDRPTILRKLNTIERKVDSLIQRREDNSWLFKIRWLQRYWYEFWYAVLLRMPKTLFSK
jgi:DNA repair exonuclease SbcCD ATPase subunit